MDIDSLHCVLLSRIYDDFYRFVLMLADVPDDRILEAEQAERELSLETSDIRRLWDYRLNHLLWLLRHVPRDEFIVAHTPSPESNPGVRMGTETMKELAAKASTVEHFFALCEESNREYDRRIAGRCGDALNSPCSAVVTTTPALSPEEIKATFKAMFAEAARQSEHENATIISSAHEANTQERQNNDKL